MNQRPEELQLVRPLVQEAERHLGAHNSMSVLFLIFHTSDRARP
jgi:hypothetical protein